MRILVLAAALASVPVLGSAAPTETPLGRLPADARPLAYRLDLTILPDQPRFSGHAEIDIEVKSRLSRLFIHGRDLAVRTARVRAAGAETPAAYAQVDPLGVVRLDFPHPLEPGRATLVFDYDAPFGEGAAGLYHVKVGQDWYAWTQFESIDARAAYPGFDEPGFKTPFSVSVTTRKGALAYANARETSAAPAGDLVRHQFAPTRPLPTYLVAFGAGPFVAASGAAAPTPQRAKALPTRIIATQPNGDKTAFALENTGPIVGLLEGYFGRPFPFSKLDQIGSPVMPGAMENAGADTYGDSILFLDQGASTAQKREFGMVVAHELAHQWFGDLVTPQWWDDIWLNESFANWMGYRIGQAWRPDLAIGVGAQDEAFQAMTVDALKAGRPIHQRITSSGDIDSAFDAVTYGKGGQVVAMIAAYLGDDKFRRGVRLHLSRHLYGVATTSDFFAALAEAAGDPRVVAALKSFVDQPGVPVVRFARVPGGFRVSQKRYALLGTQMAPALWSIPLCVRVDAARRCQLLDKPSAILDLPRGGVLMPNAGGAGYYRFALEEADWSALIAKAGSLPPGEALAAADSLWAAFQAGDASPALLTAAARTLAFNPYSGAAVMGGRRLGALRRMGLIPEAEVPAYRRLIREIFAPRLAALGFDPRAEAYAADAPDRQKLRADLVGLVSDEGQDPAVRAALARAAGAFLAGETTALDQSLLGRGFRAYAALGGGKALNALFEAGLSSPDTLVRDTALGAVADAGAPAAAAFALKALEDPRLRTADRLTLLRGLMSSAGAREQGYAYLVRRYDDLVKDGGIFSASTLPSFASGFCGQDRAIRIEADLRPKIERYGRGALSLDRTVEQVRACGVLRDARGAQVAAMFAGG